MVGLMKINFELLTMISSFAGGGALGGLVLFFYYRKENKRIKQSEALLSEANARSADGSAAGETMGLLERTVSHMNYINSYNQTNLEQSVDLLIEKDFLNSKLSKDVELLQMQSMDDRLRLKKLEQTVKQELEWRKDSDYHYCTVKPCELREPPLGTFKR